MAIRRKLELVFRKSYIVKKSDVENYGMKFPPILYAYKLVLLCW